MGMFKYRQPSLKQLTGYTRVKRQIKKQTGISTIERYTKPSRIKQKVKSDLGLYSTSVKVIRQTSKGKIPKISLLGILRELIKK